LQEKSIDKSPGVRGLIKSMTLAKDFSN